MRNFFDEQGHPGEMCFAFHRAGTRVFVEAYTKYAADGNLRRTQLIGKRAISGWKLL